MAERAKRSHHQAEALAAGLPPLLVAAERVATTVSQGVHGRRRVGQGETFWQFRRYQAGDSIQRVDWRQSAKNDSVFIRETEWEAAQSVWLWRDASPSMSFTSGDMIEPKQSRADLLLMALASLLIRGGEHVALLGTGVPPASGRLVLSRLWNEIERARDTSQGLPPFEMLPRHGRLVIFSDLLSPLDQVRMAVNAFAHYGVRGHVLQIVDPAEETFPYTGRIQFEGPEGEGTAVIGNVESVAGTYKNAFKAHLEGVRSIATAAGWGYTRHRTDQAPEVALMALYLALSDQGRL
ncbi:MAG: DUF58 domain-containing protein [Rhodospirillales bacterium]|nr:DUF58 domain-containing protein [Rhodospirillales bacterium]